MLWRATALSRQPPSLLPAIRLPYRRGSPCRFSTPAQELATLRLARICEAANASLWRRERIFPRPRLARLGLLSGCGICRQGLRLSRCLRLSGVILRLRRRLRFRARLFGKANVSGTQKPNVAAQKSRGCTPYHPVLPEISKSANGQSHAMIERAARSKCITPRTGSPAQSEEEPAP